MPQRFSSTANSMFTRLKSTPTTVLRGSPKGVWDTRAWISVKMGRFPSMAAVITDPDTGSSLASRNSPEGLATSRSPSSSMEKIPHSLVEPNRFFRARSTR